MTTIFAGPTVFVHELDPLRQRKKVVTEYGAGAFGLRQPLTSDAGGYTAAHPTAPFHARPLMRGSTRTRKRSHLLALSGRPDALPGEQPHMRTIATYLSSHFLNQPVSVLTQAGRVYGTLFAVAHDEITLVDANQRQQRLPLSSILSIGPRS